MKPPDEILYDALSECGWEDHENDLAFAIRKLTAAGYKIMAREPTDAMRYAGWDQDTPTEVYQAMWDAAP